MSSLTHAAVGEVGLVLPPTITQLTTEGHNRQPLLFEDKGFFYVSRDRRGHKDPQIYYKDFSTGAEHRVTHQRGHVIGGIWIQDGRLVYASSTDEDKETPERLKPYLDRFPAEVDTQFFFHLNLKPTEIYSSNFQGLDITRLSKHMGLDAFPSYVSKNKKLYFSRLENEKINIFSQSPSSKFSPRLVMKTLGHDLGLQLSPDGSQFAWYRFSPDFKTSQIMVSKTDFKSPQFLTIDSGIQWTPTWHPDQKSILYSAKKANDKNYQIYEISVDGTCQRKITSLEGDEFYPVLSKDGTALLFTGTQSGQEQIHKMNYPGPLNCQKNQQGVPSETVI